MNPLNLPDHVLVWPSGYFPVHLCQLVCSWKKFYLCVCFNVGIMIGV